MDPVSCRSNAAFLEKQIGTLSDDKIASMCGGNADCVAARQQERGLYQQAYGQALAHQDPSAAARDYLARASDAQGKSYSATDLDNALQRFKLGTSDLSNPIDVFVATAIVGNVALFGAIKGVTGVDSDGGSSSRAPKPAMPGSGGAASAANGAKLSNQLAAEEIAGGHAFEKHVTQQAEFGDAIRTPQQFAREIERVLSNPSATKQLSNGRSAYWDDTSGMVVIRNPKAADGGTAFKPTTGKAYFDGLR